VAALQTDDSTTILTGFVGINNQSYVFLDKTDLSGSLPCSVSDTLTLVKDSVSFFSPVNLTTTASTWSNNAVYSIGSNSQEQDYCSIIGIEEKLKHTEVTIFPNPNSGSFEIADKEDFETIEIFDSYGQIVYKDENFKISSKVNLQGRKKGVYFLKLNKKNGYTVSVKIVIH
jgi:hypothetical protein